MFKWIDAVCHWFNKSNKIHRTVCYNKERKNLSILFDNKKDNNVARGYNCMKKRHVYQTKFQSTLNTLFEIYSTK